MWTIIVWVNIGRICRDSIDSTQERKGEFSRCFWKAFVQHYVYIGDVKLIAFIALNL